MKNLRFLSMDESGKHSYMVESLNNLVKALSLGYCFERENHKGSTKLFKKESSTNQRLRPTRRRLAYLQSFKPAQHIAGLTID